MPSEYASQQPSGYIPQAHPEYAPEAPAFVPQEFFQEPTPDYQSLLKNMPGNNEVLLACLLALIAVVALLALAIVFVFIMSRREAAAREKEQSMYSEVFAAIKDATKEAAEDKKKKEEAVKAEKQEAAPLAPDDSLPGSEVS
jgi:flagellar biosynthesis/type III secretory pathway M-ring protein FliF/YscJ